MIEFNPDGSIKIPEAIIKNQEKKELKLKKERCILVKKELVDFKPKKCVLHIRLSDAFTDNSFISNIFKDFQKHSEVPAKLIQITEKEFDVEIGTDFRRCRDCTTLIRRLREYLSGNIIEDKGSCTLKERNFAYEDYFG
ncbi:hypothetical protein KY333_02895 [Candidatus Woesearchaeota archaeon]|nr:hypothetical protein [Candidatus Woesearchaeota archaeon]